MTRPRRATPRVSGPTWQRVKLGASCATNGHQIAAMAWALFWPFRHDRPRYVLCEPCAALKGYTRPDRPFVLRRDAPEDVRARQAGGDD